MGLLATGAHVAAAIAGFRRRHVLQLLFAWNLAVLLAFTLVYRFGGLDHMDMPGGAPPSWHHALYFAAITHYSFTPPYEPKDTAGRVLVALHATMSWVPIFLIIFSPGGPADTLRGAAHQRTYSSGAAYM